MDRPAFDRCPLCDGGHLRYLFAHAGYRPLEIPVNYRSRSFAEGKKVSLIRDPLTWIRACFKYRVQPLGKKAR